MRLLRFVLRRALYTILQLLGVITVAFFLTHLVPGNPARSLAGIGATQANVAAIERQLGLDRPLVVQYGLYLKNVVRGDLGDSIFTGQSVREDLAQRLPATLGLVTISITLAVLIGVPLGMYVGIKPGGIRSKIVFVYGMLTGALADFWLALLFIFVFFYTLQWAPAPLGQLGPIMSPSDRITGFYLLDSALTGRWDIFVEALRHLVLPVATLVLVYMGNIVKMARSSMAETMQSDYVEHARAVGLSERTVLRYALRNALAPVITVTAFTYGFLIGGAVLVETVFSWGGLGEYAVQSITNSDYFPILGVVLVAGLFMSMLYLVLDILYAVLDPRVHL